MRKQIYKAICERISQQVSEVKHIDPTIAEGEPQNLDI